MKIINQLSFIAVNIQEFLNTPITDPKFPVYLNAIAAVVIPTFLIILAFLFYQLHKRSSKTQINEHKVKEK